MAGGGAVWMVESGTSAVALSVPVGTMLWGGSILLEVTVGWVVGGSVGMRAGVVEGGVGVTMGSVSLFAGGGGGWSDGLLVGSIVGFVG